MFARRARRCLLILLLLLPLGTFLSPQRAQAQNCTTIYPSNVEFVVGYDNNGIFQGVVDPHNQNLRKVEFIAQVNWVVQGTASVRWEWATGNLNYPVANFSHYPSGEAWGGFYQVGYSAQNWKAISINNNAGLVTTARFRFYVAAGGAVNMRVRNLQLCGSAPPSGSPVYTSDPQPGVTIPLGPTGIGQQIIDWNALVIGNVGTAMLTISSFSIDGPHEDDFAMETEAPFDVSPGGSAEVGISCTPSGAGVRSAELTVTTNDPEKPSVSYPIRCNQEIVSPPPYYGVCLLLGQAATFRSGWTFSGGAERPVGALEGVSLPDGSSARMALSLPSSQQYSVAVAWHATDPQPDQYFVITLGDSAGLRVDMPNDDEAHIYTFPAASYSPDAGGGYGLVISKPPGPGSDPGLVVDYICLIASGSTLVYEQEEPAFCEACVFEAQGDLVHDLPAIIEWLFCGIRRLIECEVLPVLRGIWASVNESIVFFASFRLWLELTAQSLMEATNANSQIMMAYLGGHVGNIGPSLANANSQIMILGGHVGNIGPSLANALGPGSPQTSLEGSLRDPVSGLAHAFASLAFMVPEFIGAMTDGFNTAAYEPVSGSISCASPTTLLYYPCLGFYVADNTIFQGPAAYLIPILMAVMAWDTLTWAVTKFKEAFK